MSFVEDARDLVGFVRGACLIAVVRQVSRSPRRDDVRQGLSGALGAAVCEFAGPLAAYTSVDRESIEESPRELLEEGVEEFYEVQNINMQLGLLSRKPIPIYPFVTTTAVDSVVLMRPFLDVSKNLLHAAVRLRMQTKIPSPQTEFWEQAHLFLRRCWGGDLPAGLFRCISSDVASDIIFHNHDIANRSDADQSVPARIVFDELRQAFRERSRPVAPRSET